MANSTANSEECPLKIYVQNFPDVGVIEDNYPVADFLEPDFELPPIGNAKFRWFHIPANNMAWVEVSLANQKPQYYLSEIELTNPGTLSNAPRSLSRSFLGSTRKLGLSSSSQPCLKFPNLCMLGKWSLRVSQAKM
jgi:hypothetical protein